MRYNEFKIAEAILSKVTDDKYLPQVNKALASQDPVLQIGKQGERSIKADPGQTVSSRSDRITGTIIDTDGTELPNKQVAVSGLYKPGEWTGGKADKEKLLLKPSHIFPNGRFNGSKVFDAVIKNSVLQDTDYGQMVIKMAEEIRTGNNARFDNIPKEFQKAIQDYAGEYLGVLALIKGTANFPTRKEWLAHLGVSSLNEIEMFFPEAVSNPLADSIGYFKNAKTGNSILVSSKGKDGAAPSLDGLKIPENLKDSNTYTAEVDFVTTMQTQGTAFSQPFYGINSLQQQGVKMPKYLKAIMPFDETKIQQILNWYKDKTFTMAKIKKLPKPYRLLLDANLKRTRNPDVPLGGMIQYAIKSELKRMINVDKVLSNFETMAREILEYNFIQIHAEPRNGALEFDVLWPNKEMGKGKITLETKYGAAAASQGKMSFKVARN